MRSLTGSMPPGHRAGSRNCNRICDLRFAICDVRCAMCDLRFGICELRIAICDLRCANCDVRFAMCDVRIAICDLRFAICEFTICDLRIWRLNADIQQTTPPICQTAVGGLPCWDLRFAICDLRFAICDLRFAICDLRCAMCDVRFAICEFDGIENRKSKIENVTTAYCLKPFSIPMTVRHLAIAEIVILVILFRGVEL